MKKMKKADADAFAAAKKTMAGALGALAAAQSLMGGSPLSLVPDLGWVI